MTTSDHEILAAAMDRILPSRDDAGATAANAIGYARWIMNHESFRTQIPCMTMGLRLLEDASTALHGRGFCACDPAQRDRIITAVRGLPHQTVERFFVMLVRMTIAGFLCNPRYGGNRDGVGWRFIGYHPHPSQGPGGSS